MIRPVVVAVLATLAVPLAAQQPGREEIRQAARELMTEVRYCALATVDGEGRPRLRAMDPFPPEPDLTVWLATRRGTRKLAEIESRPAASLYYFDALGAGYVTLIGEIEVVDDPAERAARFKGEWREFYDDENRGDDYRLLRFRPHTLEMVSVARGIAAGPRDWRPAIVDLGDGR